MHHPPWLNTSFAKQLDMLLAAAPTATPTGPEVLAPSDSAAGHSLDAARMATAC